MGRDLVGGEIGCYRSHVGCAEAFLASDADYAVVFEDDLKVTSDLKTIIEESLQWLSENYKNSWYLINIGNEKLKISKPIRSFGPANNHHTLHQAFYFPMTTTGLIWNREGAEKFLVESSKIFAPVDNFLRYWLTRTGTGLAFSPPLVRTTGVESTIDASKIKKTRKSESKVFLHGLVKQRRLASEKIIAIKHLFNSLIKR
jgi:glycosyl transferase family 25